MPKLLNNLKTIWFSRDLRGHRSVALGEKIFLEVTEIVYVKKTKLDFNKFFLFPGRKKCFTNSDRHWFSVAGQTSENSCKIQIAQQRELLINGNKEQFEGCRSSSGGSCEVISSKGFHFPAFPPTPCSALAGAHPEHPQQLPGHLGRAALIFTPKRSICSTERHLIPPQTLFLTMALVTGDPLIAPQ